MNYGTSINGRNAQSEGRAPASTVAKWIGNGITAAWIAKHVASNEWHHSQANLGGNGKPVVYYSREDTLALWLTSNFAARHQSAAAKRRLPNLLRLARVWELMGCIGELPTAAPLAGKKAKAEVEVLGTIDLTRRQYAKSSRGYRPEESTLRVEGAEWRGEWLVWTDGRCKRTSVVRIVAISEEQAIADMLSLWFASEVVPHLRRVGDAARRRAVREQELTFLLAAYRRQPTENRANELVRRFGYTAEQIAAILEG